MKILIVLEYYYPHIGGVETVFQELGERFVKLGHEVHIVTMLLPDTRDFEIINGVNIHRVKVPKLGSRYWFDFFFSIPKITELAKFSDIIHASDYVTAFPVWVVAKFRNKPCIMTVHELIGGMFYSVLGEKFCKAKVLQFFERFLIKLPFDKYVCVSNNTKNGVRFIGIFDEKITTIYHGIDEKLFNNNIACKINIKEKFQIQGKFVYLSFGRPGVTKGIEYLIQAVPFISEKIPNSGLLLILSKNPIERYEMIEKMISEQKSENIILINPVPRIELPDYIASSDCVVVPSLTEGFGFTAAEACTMDKPVVSTNVGSLPEVVSGRYILIEPRNPKAIASAVIQVAQGDIESSSKKTFSWDNAVNKYLDLYNQVK